MALEFLMWSPFFMCIPSFCGRLPEEPLANLRARIIFASKSDSYEHILYFDSIIYWREYLYLLPGKSGSFCFSEKSESRVSDNSVPGCIVYVHFLFLSRCSVPVVVHTVDLQLRKRLAGIYIIYGVVACRHRHYRDIPEVSLWFLCFFVVDIFHTGVRLL